MEAKPTIDLNDPRVCARYAVTTASMGRNVWVMLDLAPARQAEPLAVAPLPPAEARQLALLLWEAAEAADRRMNEAAQPREGQ